MRYVECACTGPDPVLSFEQCMPNCQIVFRKACCILPNTVQLPNCSTGRHVWMEIVQKLVAVALVSVVSSAGGFQLPVALSLGMAATSALVQPYAQPQAFMDSQFLFETFGYRLPRNWVFGVLPFPQVVKILRKACTVIIVHEWCCLSWCWLF